MSPVGVSGVAIASTVIDWAIAPIAVDWAIAPIAVDWAVVIVAFLVLLGTSGRVVKTALGWADDAYADSVTEAERDIGTVVGKTENVLLLTLVLVGAYTAIAVIFAAKSIVRSEDMKNDSLFYLAGTLVNVTYSLVVGVVVRVLLGVSATAPVL